MTQYSRGAVGTLLLLVAVVACSSDRAGDVTPTVTAPQPITNVGPAGGSLTLAGGLVRLEVPPGALASAVNIEAVATVAYPPSFLLVPNTVYELRPAGLRFSIPAVLTVRYSPEAVPAVVSPNELRMFYAPTSDVWQPIAGSRESSGTAISPVFALGVFGILGAPVASISTSPENVQLRSEGEIVQLTAVVRDADGNVLLRRPVTWVSSDSMSARVTANGLVTVSSGLASITATSEGRSASTTLQVLADAAKPYLLEDFSTYTSTQDFAANPHAWYNPAEDMAVPAPRAGTIASQAMVAGNSYAISGTGTRFTTETIRYGILSTGDVKILITSITDDTHFTGTAVTTGTLSGAYSHPNWSNGVLPVELDDVVLDKTVGYGSSTQSMRFDFYDRSGQADRCQDNSISRSMRAGLGKHLWAEVWVKFGTNFKVTAPAAWGCVSAPAYKFILGGATGGNGRFGFTMTEHVWAEDTPDRGPVLFDLPDATTVRDGQWHRYRVEWKVSSATDVADAKQRIWIDNLLAYDSGNIIVNRDDVTVLRLGANMNQGPAALQSVWWSRIRLFRSNPAW